MNTIQQVLFELERDYMGHSYFVTGHALYTALARRVDARARQALHVSTGVFVPGEYGAYPESHSHDGYAGKLGMSLPPVEAYEDVFVFRDAAQRWLLDSRPRDAHNTHGIQNHGGRLAVAPATRFGRPPEHRNTKRTMRWFVHCYLHGDGGDEDILPLSEGVLDGLRVGGARNYGLGELSLTDTQGIDVDALDYSRVRAADDVQLELLSPYVLASDYPGADSQSVPWWWASDGRLRRRTTRLIAGDDAYDVATVDHGQVVEYTGNQPVETAKNGILRVGTHAKYGFGEFRLRPGDADRVPERAQAGEQRTAGES